MKNFKQYILEGEPSSVLPSEITDPPNTKVNTLSYSGNKTREPIKTKIVNKKNTNVDSSTNMSADTATSSNPTPSKSPTSNSNTKLI
jgi:hypothetical protein